MYKSYNENAIKYLLVEKTQLTNLICLFACPDCLSEKSMTLIDANVKGYANTFTISCSHCEFSTPFETSPRISQDKNSTKPPPYDVNSRFVYSFDALGKGHRDLETFSMHFNMKPMQSKAYILHEKPLCKIVEANVQRNLEQARVDVRKVYEVLESLDESDDDTPIIDLTVSYDGSWHKRGFTLKYGVGCCIQVTTGLIIDFELLSKICSLCATMKEKLKICRSSLKIGKKVTNQTVNVIMKDLPQ